MLYTMILRNTKLFFKDKGMFFTALITPLVLLVLYVTFLGSVYADSFRSSIPEGIAVSDTIVNSMVAGELLSSLLAVCCITVAFCANMRMVQDKITGAQKDIAISPAKSHLISISYFISSALVTWIICFIALLAGLIYVHAVGYDMALSDVAWMILDIVMLVLFGTSLSSICNSFLSTQGQVSAVGTIVSAGYGFVCGAYMPISSFGDTLQKVLLFLPGTYGTSLIRNHALHGVFEKLEAQQLPADLITGIREAMDCRLLFFEREVPLSMMYVILGTAVAVLTAGYVLIHILQEKKDR